MFCEMIKRCPDSERHIHFELPDCVLAGMLRLSLESYGERAPSRIVNVVHQSDLLVDLFARQGNYIRGANHE